MPTRHSCLSFRLLTLGLLLLPAAVSAQGTLADYQRAISLRTKLQGMVVNAPDQATWIAGTERFFYRKSVAGGNEFEMVDATTQQKRPAFDHARLASALAAAGGHTYTALTLPFNNVTFVNGEGAIEFVADTARWRCTVSDYQCSRLGPAGPGFGRGGRGGGGGQFQGGRGQGAGSEAEPVRLSPDGKTEALIENYNLYVRPAGTHNATALSWDGSEGNAYVLQSISWAPDSKKLAAYRVIPGYRRMVHYVESSPADQLQPRSFERFYAKPGDVLDKEQPVLFNLACEAGVHRR